MAICCMFVYDPAATSGVEKLRARMVGIRPLGVFLYLNWVDGFLIHHVFYCSMLQDVSGFPGISCVVRGLRKIVSPIYLCPYL